MDGQRERDIHSMTTKCLLDEIKRIEKVLIILTREIERHNAEFVWLKNDYLDYLKVANDVLKKRK